MPKAALSVWMASRLGFAPPVSMRDAYVLANPHLAANASWVNP